jgi:hypothetical protein
VPAAAFNVDLVHSVLARLIEEIKSERADRVKLADTRNV